MEREWRVVIPKQDNDGQQIRFDLLAGYIEEVSRHFGGATVYPKTQGCWMMQQLYGGEVLHCEPTMVVDVIRTGVDRGQITADGQWLADFATRIAVQLGQEAVFEQQDLATRTEFRPGRALQRLPADMIQQGPPPATPLARALGE